MDYESYKDTDYIPTNYFCKFQMLLHQDIDWELIVYRYVSILYMEQLEMVLHSSIKTYYDDEYLRSRSFIYADNGRNYTSHASFDIKGSATQLDIYARNVLKVKGKTFLVILQEQRGSYSFISSIYSILTFLFTMTLCCLCFVGCCRCFLTKSGIDYNVD